MKPEMPRSSLRQGRAAATAGTRRGAAWPAVVQFVLIFAAFTSAYAFDAGGVIIDRTVPGPDTLHPFYMLRDILQHPDLAFGWDVPDAPYFLPDLVLVGLGMLLAGGPKVSTVLAGFLQGFAILGLLFYLFRRTFGPVGGFAIGAALAVAAVFLLVEGELELASGLHTFGPTFKIFYHGGALLFALWLLVLETPQAQGPTVPLVAGRSLAIVAILGAGLISDPFLLVFFALPFAGARIWQVLDGQIAWRDLPPVLARIAGAVVVMACARLVAATDTNMRIEGWDTAGEILANLGTWLDYITVDPDLENGSSFFLALQIFQKVPVLATLAVLLWATVRRRPLPGVAAWPGNGADILLRFFTLAFFVNSGAVFVTDLYINAWSARYLPMVTYGWVALVAAWLALAMARLRPDMGKLAARLGVPALAVAVAGAAWSLPDRALTRWFIAPNLGDRAYSQCLERAVARYGGEGPHILVAFYTYGRRAMADTERLDSFTVDRTGKPVPARYNHAHYRMRFFERTGLLRGAAFVFTRALKQSRVRARFGPADHRLSCGEDHVLVYLDPRRVARRLAGGQP